MHQSSSHKGELSSQRSENQVLILVELKPPTLIQALSMEFSHQMSFNGFGTSPRNPSRPRGVSKSPSQPEDLLLFFYHVKVQGFAYKSPSLSLVKKNLP